MINLPELREANLENKHILMRVDFNVGELAGGEGGKLKEKYKIESVKKSVDFILSKPGVKLALASHLGRPQSREKEFSFENIYKNIEKILGVNIVFVKDCIGEEVKNKLEELKEGQILLLENVRFHKEEERGDKNFAKSLVENFDVYVNEAFGVSHRSHASLVGVSDFLPYYFGFHFKKEIEELGKIRLPKKPAIAIIGGAKIKTKLPMIEFFSKTYDNVLVGGRLGLEAEEKKIIFSENVIIPKDYVCEELDIGSKTIKEFADPIEKAVTIVWNGPLGKFENKDCFLGTKKISELIVSNKNAFKVAGGGETIEVLERLDLLDKFDFVSTGGGAMLDYLVDGTLPVLDKFNKNKI